MFSKIKDVAKTSISNASKFIMKNNRIFLAVILCISFALSVFAVGKKVNVFKVYDGNTVKTVRIMSNDVNYAIKSSCPVSDDYQILETSKKGDSTFVAIGYTFPVNIVVGDKMIVVKTTQTTVGNILKLAGFNINDYDLVQPTVDTVIDGECTINYSKVNFVTGSYTETIPCSLETVYSSDKVKGDNTVIHGVDGQKQVYYTSKTVNGITVETVVNDVVVLSNAINGKQIIGTAIPKISAVKTSEQVSSVSTLKPNSPIELDSNGVPINYKNKLNVQATGYTYTGHKCATGVTPQPGYIAVNPKVIPYGTKMYIKSSDGAYVYGYAVAADTGGFTRSRPKNVDLFFGSKSAAVAFGRRNVEIYILE